MQCRMSICGVSPGIITLNAAVSSCELTGQWQRAMGILSRLRCVLRWVMVPENRSFERVDERDSVTDHHGS